MIYPSQDCNIVGYDLLRKRSLFRGRKGKGKIFLEEDSAYPQTTPIHHTTESNHHLMIEKYNKERKNQNREIELK
jgi:hypothetical protein